MSELSPYIGGALSVPNRRLRRELERQEGQRQMQISRVNANADVLAEKVSAISYIGKRALHETAMLSQLEGQLAALVPMATTRLQGVADLTCLSMAEVVGSAARELSR